MFIPAKFTYLICTLVLFVPWALLFVYRKDLRKEMIAMSIIIAMMGLFFEQFFWTVDWWHPQTITGTRVGIEDFLLGLSNGGITAVLYEELFKKRLYKYKGRAHSLSSLLFVGIILAATAYFFYIFHLSSFISWVLATIIGITILFILRRDLIIDALITGVCLTVVAFIGFMILQLFSPNFIQQTWDWQHLSGIRFYGAPLEDMIFYFLSGISIFPIYLYWKGEYLRKIPNTHKGKLKRIKH